MPSPAPYDPSDPPKHLNLADHFLEHRLRAGDGDRVALRLPTGDVSYGQVRERSLDWARVMRARGVRRDERVLIALCDGLDFVACLFGTLRLGAVAVMTNPQLEGEACARQIEYVRPRLAAVDAPAAEAFRHAADGADALESGFVVAGDDGDPDSFERLLGDAPAAEPGLVRTHRDDPAIWLWSGGTTGLPKAVVQTHRSFANTTELYGLRTLGYGPDDVILSVPKLYFGYATGSNLFFPFAAGGSSVLFPDAPTPERLFEQIERHRPTILINVPTVIQRMLDHPGAAGRDLSSLRLATSAGEALPPPLYHRWKDTFGVELLDGLGTAEMWHVFLTNRPGDVRPGTLGRVVDGFEIDVRDAEGQPVADGEVGKLWVRGDSRALGYWQNLDKTRESFRGEWFVGGDLVCRDADGYVTYCGRGDDAMKVGGRWLIPKEVEDCLAGHPDVGRCAVVPGPNEDGLTKPYAFVLPADGAVTDGLEERLKAWALERLDAYKHPRVVHLVDELPETHLGKIDRAALRSRLSS